MDGRIWKILYDHLSEKMVVESRYPETRKVDFKIIDLSKNELANNRLKLPEEWWISLVFFQAPYIALEIYTDSQMPDKKDLIIYSTAKNKIITTIERGLWEFHGQESYFYSKAEEKTKRFFQFIFKTESIEEVDYISIVNKKFLPPSSPVSYPVQYLEGDEYFNTIKQFLEAKLNIIVTAAVDYLETHNRIIIGYYIRNSNILVNFLLVLNKKGEILFDDIIGENLTGIGTDIFFATGNRVVYIKNNNEINAVQLD